MPETSKFPVVEEHKQMASEPKPVTANKAFEIEELVKAAWERTRDRFLNYILTIMVMFALYVGAVVVILIAAAVMGVLVVGTRDVALSLTVGTILAVLVVTVILYAGSWSTLASTYAIISPRKVGAIKAYKEMFPLVWGYVKVTALLALFLIGLVPLSVFTLFILIFVWMIWAVFTVFVYIEDKPRGLESLWISKSVVNTRFWGVFGRIFLVNAVLLGGYNVLLIFTQDNPRVNVLLSLLYYAIMPFVVSFQYEIYRQLKKPPTHARNTVWIVLAGIGWVLIAIILFSLVAGFIGNLPNTIKNIDRDFRNAQTSMI
ncbi:MAG: hypothetical protein N2691_05775 [Patescibacteria group bacterium]|nr:hypothetical protein [Patescibacteria group bacterium]